MSERKLSYETVHENRYSVGEEIANAVTHGIGAALAIAALVVMVVQAARRGDARHVVGYAVFGSTLFLSYISSTIYHALAAPRAKRVFEVLDHSAIFVLIAGTYTAFTLTLLPGALGWTIFGLVWGIAAAGVTFKAVFFDRARLLSVLAYVGMGWIIVFAFEPLKAAAPKLAVDLLIAGGVTYTVGALIYAIGKKVPYLHSVWHLFVLGGAACHVFSALAALPPA